MAYEPLEYKPPSPPHTDDPQVLKTFYDKELRKIASVLNDHMRLLRDIDSRATGAGH